MSLVDLTGSADASPASAGISQLTNAANNAGKGAGWNGQETVYGRNRAVTTNGSRSAPPMHRGNSGLNQATTLPIMQNGVQTGVNHSWQGNNPPRQHPGMPRYNANHLSASQTNHVNCSAQHNASGGMKSFVAFPNGASTSHSRTNAAGTSQPSKHTSSMSQQFQFHPQHPHHPLPQGTAPTGCGSYPNGNRTAGALHHHPYPLGQRPAPYAHAQRPPNFALSTVHNYPPTGYYAPPNPPRSVLAHSQARGRAEPRTSAVITTKKRPTPPLASTSAHGFSKVNRPHTHPPAGSNYGFTPPCSSGYPEPRWQHNPPPQPSPPKKLPAVEEVTKVILPPGFFAAKDDSNKLEGAKEMDSYSRLSKLISEAGGEDKSGIYETWTNPDSLSTWDAVKPMCMEPSATLPQSGSLSSSYPAQSHPEESPPRRSVRISSKSLATEVYADTRYIGVAEKKARLMWQSKKTRQRYGPLDTAKFRDYRLLPIDYFVAPMEGLDAASTQEQDAEVPHEQEKAEEMVSEESPSRWPRRRRARRSLYGEQDTPPQREVKKPKKTSQYADARVRVGDKYQAEIVPRALGNPSKTDRSGTPECDQLWDHKKAAAAMRRGENIEEFLRQSVDLNSKMLLMEALHRAGYSVAKATDEFVSLCRDSNEPSIQLQLNEIFEASTLYEHGRKDFYSIAKKIGRSVAAVLVQYYQWKAKNHDGSYSRLKKEMKAEAEYCAVCDDGGHIIVCDHCRKAYHLECLNPPLKEVPDTDDWYCPPCMKSPALLRRVPANLPRPVVEDAKVFPKKVLAFTHSVDAEEKDQAHDSSLEPAAGLCIYGPSRK